MLPTNSSCEDLSAQNIKIVTGKYLTNDIRAFTEQIWDPDDYS